MKCPPGVICIENFTLIFFLVLVTTGVVIYTRSNLILPTKIIEKTVLPLSDPHKPPLYKLSTPNKMQVPNGIPINIPTRSFDTPYRQVGILTRISGKEMILPLMGRPLYQKRNKWQYYTMSNEFNSIKLPISSDGKSCTSEYGCDDLYNGDTVFVEGYNDAFKVARYESEAPRYIPYL